MFFIVIHRGSQTKIKIVVLKDPTKIMGNKEDRKATEKMTKEYQKEDDLIKLSKFSKFAVVSSITS